MSLRELLRLSLSRLRTSRLRAALTMLGVIIGVASVVALVGVGQGTTSNITSRLAGLGTNLLTISPNGGGGSTSTLTLEDGDAIAALPTIGSVAPQISTNATVSLGPDQHDHIGHRDHPGLPDGARLRRLAGQLPDRRQPRQRPAGRRPRRDDRDEPRAHGQRHRDGDLGRRPAVPGDRHPPAQGRDRVPGSRRPGPRPDRRRPEILRRRRHRPDDRRVGHRSGPDDRCQRRDHRPPPRPARPGRRPTPPTSTSSTRPSSWRPRRRSARR